MMVQPSCPPRTVAASSKRIAAGLVVVCLVAAVLPSAAADSLDLSWSGLTTLKMTYDGVAKGEEAASLRQQIDSMGDRDGTVSPSEANTFATRFRDIIGASMTTSATGNVTFDDAAPEKVDLTGFTLIGAEGPVAVANPFTIRAELSMHFVPGHNATHVLVFQGSDDEEKDGHTVTGTLHAPAGYHIGNAAGVPGVVLSKDRATATFQDPSASHSDAVFTFEPGEVHAASAAAFVVGILALVGCVLVLRRRGGD